MIIFLDLEETVIDDWHSGMLLPGNIAIIRELLQDNDRLGLMSWAVWGDTDKGIFTRDFQSYLEDNLGHAFDPALIWSMDDWNTELFKATGLKLDRQDMFDMFKKEEVLFKLARFHPLFKNQVVALIDDAIEHDMTITVPATGCTVKFWNIKKMKRA